MAGLKRSKRPVWDMNENAARSPRVIDLFCGIGGSGYGLRQAGFDVQGCESNPDAASLYRAHVAPVATADVSVFHPPWRRAEVVFADLPGDVKSMGGGVACDPASRLSVEKGSTAWHAMRIAIQAQSRFIVFVWYARANQTTRQKLTEFVKGAGYHPKMVALSAEDYGVPQFRSRLIVVGCATKLLHQKLKWPHTTHVSPEHSHDAKKPRWRTVADVWPDVPYHSPAPTVTTSEYRSWGRLGMKGGKSKPHRMTEILASSMGAQWPWQNTPPFEELAKIQGLPPHWTWPFGWGKGRVLPMIGRAFPPIVAFHVGTRLFQALKEEGWNFARAPVL